MCGILGQFNRKELVDRDNFSEMLDTLKKRGPDQWDCFFENNIALGHRRLSIIDLSEAGKQPMFSEDKNVCIVFNGEIYNFQDLKKELKQEHIWQSKTDTETLIHGYEEFGQKIVESIEGMFAFAIFDKKNQSITLTRDHFGKKPLYYYLDDEVFCFASELKAIIKNKQIRKKLKIDDLSLLKYLFYGYIPSPNSIFDKIKKLEPASTFQFDLEKWKIINKYRYWNLEDVQINNELADENKILEKIESLLDNSVKKRLMSDVPLGIFLSGGVDSSLNAVYLAKYAKSSDSFTICYKNSPEADESQYAKRVADKLGIKCNLSYFEDKLVKENFLEILDYLDEPMADAAIVPFYYISKKASEKIKVVLSGEGGDEIFGGYPKYKAQKFIENYKYIGFLAGIAKNFMPKSSSYYKLLDSFNLLFPIRQFIFGSGSFLVDEAKELLNRKKLDLNMIFKEAIYYSKEFKPKDIVNRSLFLDCKLQLADWYLVKGDRATMANSLEMRNPLLDKKLAEFMFSLGGKWKIKSGETKYLLKKIAAKYVDHDIIYRKKSGFGVPLDKWIREDLKDLFEEYLFIDNSYFNMDYVRKIHNEHISRTADHRFKLLRIFNFNYFLKTHWHN